MPTEQEIDAAAKAVRTAMGYRHGSTVRIGGLVFDFASIARAALTAAEAVRPDRGEAVKELEWDDDGDWDGDECACDTGIGLYFITASIQTEGKLRLVLNYPADGSIYQTVLVDGVDDKQARQVAQSDFERRVNDMLTHPPKSYEDGIRDAAKVAYSTPHYVRGDIRTDAEGMMLPGSPYDQGQYDAARAILALLSSSEDVKPTVKAADVIFDPKYDNVVD